MVISLSRFTGGCMHPKEGVTVDVTVSEISGVLAVVAVSWSRSVSACGSAAASGRGRAGFQ
jgi:hypothetical protein